MTTILIPSLSIFVIIKTQGRLVAYYDLTQVVTAKVDQAKDTAAAYKLTGINKNRCFNLLVVDDQNTDWSVRPGHSSQPLSTFSSFRAKYFRGRRLHTDWDIKVDQVEFKDLSVSASSSAGVTANIRSYKSGTSNMT